jgi:N6-L-threonylcarbamoyladenine synthase
VVPELASRSHLKTISEITTQALENSNTTFEDIDALAVTSEPGLIGSLIVGSNYAKGLSLKYDMPLIPVNHIEGHLYSGCLQDDTLGFPFICLVVSGGHTALFDVKSYNEYEIIGLTKDDAAGEAFDKVAKLLDLGYPGGPVIDKLAKNGNPDAYKFPRPMMTDNNYNFSFSGLKTSVRYFIRREFPDGVPKALFSDIAASVQEAIVDVLVAKTIRAAKILKRKAVVVAGGVSANSRLRTRMNERAEKFGMRFVAPDMQYCMDNAAMIGFLAAKKFEEQENKFKDLTFTVNPTALRAKKIKCGLLI